MSLKCNPLAVAWKKDNAPGIKCAEQSNGDMWLVEWPNSLGAIPSQADLDQWGAEYLAYVAVPQSVTPRQGRLALAQLGLLATVEGYVLTQSETVQINWQYALEIRRDNPIVLAAAGALGWTAQDIDGLFALAASFPS